MLAELDTDNWEAAFNESGSPDPAQCGNGAPRATVGSDVSLVSFTREDVAELIAMAEDDGDWAEWSGVCVGRLADGRWFSIRGWCDTSGWG